MYDQLQAGLHQDWALPNKAKSRYKPPHPHDRGVNAKDIEYIDTNVVRIMSARNRFFTLASTMCLASCSFVTHFPASFCAYLGNGLQRVVSPAVTSLEAWNQTTGMN